MAASALKMTAISAVLVILLSAAAQPAVAYVDGQAQALDCPNPATPCRTECIPACDSFANMMCKRLCALTPGELVGVDQACVNQFFTPCQVACKNACEPLPVPAQTP